LKDNEPANTSDIPGDFLDSPDILVGDKEIVKHSTPMHWLGSVLNTILHPPSIPANTNLTPSEQWQEYCSGEGKVWFLAWEKLSKLDLVNYIKLSNGFPEVLFLTNNLPLESKGSLPYQRLRLVQRGISVWMLCITQPNYSPHPRWQDYKPYGLQAKAMLDLCVAVYNHKGSNNIMHGSLGLFSSGHHLWFWCFVAQCIKRLQAKGLTTPLSDKQLKTKAILLSEWQENTKNIKERKKGSFGESWNWQEFITNVDNHVLGEAMKGNYVRDNDVDYLDAFTQVEAHTRNQFRRSKVYQVSCLYRFKNNTTIYTHITEASIKRPKASRLRKRNQSR
jgi:hypothetical protein